MERGCAVWCGAVRFDASLRVARKRKQERTLRTYARGVCVASWRVERVVVDRESPCEKNGTIGRIGRVRVSVSMSVRGEMEGVEEGEAPTPMRSIHYASVAHQLSVMGMSWEKRG